MTVTISEDTTTTELTVVQRPTVQKTVGGKTVTLTPEQAEELGRELDALKDRVIADLGDRDATYIRRIIKAQRGLEIGGRAMLMGGIFPPLWLAGTAMLGISKILDNMEIGHNVMHGQYDWMGDPAISSRGFEWDTACPGDQWRPAQLHAPHVHQHRRHGPRHRLQEICKRYGIPYNSGSLPRQFGTVVRKIVKLALP